MDPYATHLAPLVTAALEADGPILELGCGDYSTPVLAAIARYKGVPFRVMTADPSWAAKFMAVADVSIVDWSCVAFTGRYGLVFLDNEEKTRDRIHHLPVLSRVTRCVVLHDLEWCEARPQWPEMIAGFASLERHTRYQPGTGVLRC